MPPAASNWQSPDDVTDSAIATRRLSAGLLSIVKTDKTTPPATVGTRCCPLSKETRNRKVLVLQKKITVKMQLSLRS
jgi:hypothetical protein